MKKYIAKNIRHLRTLRGLTQEQMAAKIKTSRANIGAYEEGRAAPPYEIVKEYCRIFKFTMEELYEIDLAERHPNLREKIKTEKQEAAEEKEKNWFLNAIASAPSEIKHTIKILLESFSEPIY